jgi:outer membrane protein assembly factor BamD (BamD/ComL family)
MTITNRVRTAMPARRSLWWPACAAVALLAGCSSQMVTFETKLLVEADSLFRNGNFEYAKARYAKVHAEFPNSHSGAQAQYMLGYLNLYYDNPFASWDASLKEFKTFAAQYPDNELIPQVNSWIRLLVVLQSFKRQYDISQAEVASLEKELQDKRQSSNPHQIEAKYEVLMEALQRSDNEKDSLASRIRVLEEVIDKLGKNP